jgi:hypothetical protein
MAKLTPTAPTTPTIDTVCQGCDQHADCIHIDLAETYPELSGAYCLECLGDALVMLRQERGEPGPTFALVGER